MNPRLRKLGAAVEGFAPVHPPATFPLGVGADRYAEAHLNPVVQHDVLI